MMCGQTGRAATDRYGIMLVPHDQKNNAIVMEFKVHEADEEETLEDTVQAALKQIREKNYDAGLICSRNPKREDQTLRICF